MQRTPQDLSPAPSNKLCRAVGKTLVAIGNAVTRFLGPFAAIAAIFAPALMAVGVTSMWMMYWIICGKSAPWFVQNLHEALATRMPDALWFGVTLLLIAVAATTLGLLSVKIGYTILRSGNHVLSGTSKQKIGSIIYGAGRVVQIPIYLTALFAIALLGLTLSLSFLVMLFLNAAGAELTPLDGIESLFTRSAGGPRIDPWGMTLCRTLSW